MHSQPIPPEIKSRNKRVVWWLIGTVGTFTILSLLYLVKYGVNFQRHGFH